MNLWNEVKSVFERVVGRIKSFFGIGSPSRMFFGMGKDIAAGLVKGMLNSRSAVNAAAQKLASAAGVEQHVATRRGGGLAATQGLNPEFLRRFHQYNAALGGILRIVSGFRSTAQQAELYRRYLAGTGNLAAPPGRSMHERGLAIDHAPRSTPAMRNVARNFRLHYPVGGEPWHVEPFAQGATFRRPTVLSNALIGERGTEHLLREDQIEKIMRRALDGGGSQDTINIHVNDDRVALEQLDRRDRIRRARASARAGR